MGIRIVVRGILSALLVFVATAAFSDTIVGSGTSGFQNCGVAELKNNGKPYWDNKSVDGSNKKQRKTSNIDFYLASPSFVPLDDGPNNPLPYWGKNRKSDKKTGGNADLNFFCQRDASNTVASLTLEMFSTSNPDELGWYDLTDSAVLHPIVLGSDSPSTNVFTFSPSPQYGLYLKRDDQATFYTQSSRNPFKDTLHQHFAIFQQSATPGAEVCRIGIKDRTRRELTGKEGELGDYNDLLIRIGPARPIPGPSTVVPVLGGAFCIGLMALRKKSPLAGSILRRRRMSSNRPKTGPRRRATVSSRSSLLGWEYSR